MFAEHRFEQHKRFSCVATERSAQRNSSNMFVGISRVCFNAAKYNNRLTRCDFKQFRVRYMYFS